MYKYLFKIGSMAVVAVAFMACSNNDIFDEQAVIDQKKATYAENFEKAYGKIDPNQTWDFSTMQQHYNVSAPTSVTSTTTRGMFADWLNAILGSIFYPNTNPSVPTTNTNPITNPNSDNYDKMIIEKDVIEWIGDNMKAGQNNEKKGTFFKMKTKGEPFSIVPMFQGTASYYWELWLEVEGYEDQLIWEKGKHLGYRMSKGGQLYQPGESNTGVDVNAYEVEAPVYTFDLPKGLTMAFYLKVFPNGKGNPNGAAVMSSASNHMIHVSTLPKPKNVPEGNDVTVIGCEDNPTAGADADYEDLVFMMYSKSLPNIERVDTVVVDQTKRYMIEDLGSESDDFDFNDIVVDVAQFVKKQLIYTYDDNYGLVLSDEVVLDTLPQAAIVRAAGGTLDFTLTIGNTTWTKSEHCTVGEMMNTGWNNTEIKPNAVIGAFEVDGWDPAANNISVVVNSPKYGNIKIEFPKKGEAPMIVAFDALPFQSWMHERVRMPQEWIK